jgi:hypothetical protein
MYEYNPIVRTFNQVRAVILAATDTPRGRIRPSATLASVIPPERWQAVGAELQRRGLPGPYWTPPPRDDLALGCVHSGAVPSIGQVLGSGWLLARLWLLAAIPVNLFLCLADFGREVEWSLGRWTVGDLAVYCTRFPEHRASGYRWSRGDIALKVRLIVAVWLGVAPEKVREDASFIDMAA